ncbi:restriction endonuclease subunit S [Vineibacter terrae]|uniref:Restriction endonuclease subunit S n=1 Tax=Vineibacter terrae TaxID=2586908 RepID=A0A5C8PM84_9HYPH|nr:restriction endonuclease subunit S [Vineibacter terrae]TXL75121.1 restriction endonuclease subunit S [Vineibacter terrae]
MTGTMLAHKPDGWDIAKLGQYFEQRNDKVNDEEYPPLSVTYDGVVPQMEHVAKSEDRDNRKKVCQGDLVINSRSDRRGASGLSDYDGSVSLINIVLKPRLGCPRFFHYLMRSIAFQEEYYRYGHGIVADLWTTRYTELKNICVAVPDWETQQRIANFLDRFSSLIDSLIDKKLRQIALIKDEENACVAGHMSDGGRRSFRKTDLPWIPEIPDDWKLRRAKYLFRCLSRPPLDDDKIVTAFRDGQVTLRENRRLTGYTLAVKEVGYQHINQGDLVIHTMDAFAGAIGVSDSDGKATGEYAVCEPIAAGINNHFFAQILRYMAAQNYIYVLCPSVRERAPRFRFSKLAPVMLPVPTKDEQDRIALVIERSRALRNRLQRSIFLLKEHRSSLITKAVTGEIEVASEHWGDAERSMKRIEGKLCRREATA